MVKELQTEKVKIAYLHGRPGPHPMHGKFSEAVGAEFHFVDFKMRWQDKDRSILYQVLSWIVCAITFPKKREYKIFLVDNLHFWPVLMKMFFLIGKKQKIIAHMGSHTLYFIYAHKFSKLTEWMHIQALKRYDVLICEGDMAELLVKKILGDKTPKLYTVFNGIPYEHFPNETSKTKNITGKNILFMGHGPNLSRMWYKGLDLMLLAFQLAFEKDPTLTFTIVGKWDNDIIENLLKEFDTKTKNAIKFVGSNDDLGKYTQEASLYLHCARGEAYGLTILIALASGLPSIVSEWTGAKEIVEKIDKRLIVPLDVKEIADKIIWYFTLSQEEKQLISDKSISLTKNYTEENAINFYKTTFSKILKDIEKEK